MKINTYKLSIILILQFFLLSNCISLTVRPGIIYDVKSKSIKSATIIEKDKPIKQKKHYTQPEIKLTDPKHKKSMAPKQQSKLNVIPETRKVQIYSQKKPTIYSQQNAVMNNKKFYFEKDGTVKVWNPASNSYESRGNW